MLGVKTAGVVLLILGGARGECIYVDNESRGFGVPVGGRGWVFSGLLAVWGFQSDQGGTCGKEREGYCFEPVGEGGACVRWGGGSACWQSIFHDGEQHEMVSLARVFSRLSPATP